MLKKITLKNSLAWILIIGGIVGLFASIMILHEYISSIKDPNYVPVCNLNPIFSCSSVTNSSQAHAFGFLNEYIGLAGYAALATFGFALAAGAQFKRWFWRLINIGMLFAVGFVTWLQYETIYHINALCLFCMVIWLVTIPCFWYLTLYNVDSKNITLPKKLRTTYAFVRRNHLGFLILWYLVIAAQILNHFWYYWKSLI